MAVTITNTNWNGEVISDLYKLLVTSNEVFSQNSARIITGVKDKLSLGQITMAANPLGAYETTPTSETADTDYSERELNMVKMMFYELIDPVQWHEIWEPFASQGMTFTNLALNPEIMRAVFELISNRVGQQLSEMFWQGDVANPGEFSGIVTRATADASVIDVTNIGLITQANVIAVLEDCYEAIPDQFINDPDYALHIRTSHYKQLQLANQASAAGTSGYLGNVVRDLFLNHRIKPYSGMPTNTVVGAKGTTGADSNLVWGFYAMPDDEIGAPILDNLQNNSRQKFTRFDMKSDANYRAGSEIILYQGA